MEFHRADHQAAFDDDGFVVVDLLEDDDLAALRAAWVALEADLGTTFWASAGADADRAGRASDQIVELVRSRLDRVLEDSVAIGGSFLVKPTGPDAAMEVHQDWTSVPEDSVRSANVWCPLDDIDPRRGPLVVLPGSHRWFDAVRSPTLPSVQVPLDEVVDRGAVLVEVRAGQAVVYDHALLHGSLANRHAEPRVVVQVGVAPHGAPIVLGFPEGSRAALREVHPQDYLATAAGERLPHGPVVAVGSAAPVQVDDVLARLRPADIGSPDSSSGWWAGLRGRLGRARR